MQDAHLLIKPRMLLPFTLLVRLGPRLRWPVCFVKLVVHAVVLKTKEETKFFARESGAKD